MTTNIEAVLVATRMGSSMEIVALKGQYFQSSPSGKRIELWSKRGALAHRVSYWQFGRVLFVRLQGSQVWTPNEKLHWNDTK